MEEADDGQAARFFTPEDFSGATDGDFVGDDALLEHFPEKRNPVSRKKMHENREMERRDGDTDARFLALRRDLAALKAHLRGLYRGA